MVVPSPAMSEVLSRVPMGATTAVKDFGRPVNKRYWEYYEFTSQFEGAERIAEKWEITRDDTDAYGARSQALAAKAWDEDAFATQIVPVTVPQRKGEPVIVNRDEGIRPDTSLDKLAKLRPKLPPTTQAA